MAAPLEYALGIDLGTSGGKALAVGTDSRLLAAAEVRYPMTVPQLEHRPAGRAANIGLGC